MRDMSPLQGWVISAACLTVIYLLAPIDPYEVGRDLYHTIKRSTLIVTVSLSD